MNRSILAVLVVASGLTACTNEQINMATQGIGIYNATRAGGGGNGAEVAASAGLSIATPTSSQTKQVASLMTKNTGNASVNMVLPEAASVMSPFLLAVSCHKTTGNELPTLSARYVAGNASGRFTGALTGMNKHPAGRCADVSSLSGWSRNGANLSFKANFRSAQSGEVQVRQYTMTKQSSGAWLFSAGN